MTAAVPEHGSEQLSQIPNLLRDLDISLRTNDTANPACDELLEQLYGLTRTSSGHDLAFSLGESGIATLGRYSFDAVSPIARRSALRCLHNVLVLSEPTRQIFVDQDFPEKAIELVKSDHAVDELLAARILVLCSRHTTLDLLPYLERGNLAMTINANILRHAKAADTPSAEPTSACNASLNLLSTLAVQHGAQAYRFLESLKPILDMFDRASIPSPPLEPPVSTLIACLATIPFYDETHTTGKNHWPSFHEDKLVEVLDLATRAYEDKDLETHIMPLVYLLFLIARSAPVDVKERLQVRLLPSDQDRTTALGRGNSLPHRLVRISTEAMTLQLKNSLASLFLELSDDDPQQLVHNVGFGCGSGLLQSLGKPLLLGDVEAGEGGRDQSDVNPITGQRWDTEYQPSLPELTQEEKEREAEKLFVLFERLKKTGVVDVENPVGQALRSGRIQEIEDDVDNN